MYFFFYYIKQIGQCGISSKISLHKKPPSSTYAEAKSKVGITRKNIKM